MHKLVQNLHDVYKANFDCRTVNYRTMQKYGQLSLRLAQWGTLFAFVSCLTFLPLTLIKNFITGKREPLLQAFLPFIDESTTVGYNILFTYHLIFLLLGATGLVGADLLPIMLVVNLRMMADIFANMFNDLNDALVNLSANRRDSAELRRYFRNIILVHVEFCDYLKRFSSVFVFWLLNEIITDAISLCLVQVALLKVRLGEKVGKLLFLNSTNKNTNSIHCVSHVFFHLCHIKHTLRSS